MQECYVCHVYLFLSCNYVFELDSFCIEVTSSGIFRRCNVSVVLCFYLLQYRSQDESKEENLDIIMICFLVKCILTHLSQVSQQIHALPSSPSSDSSMKYI